MKRTNACKHIVSTLLLLCMLLSCVEYTAFAAPVARDGEVVKQGTLVSSEDDMVTVQETAAHTSGNNFDVTMTVTTSDLVEIEPVRPAHIVLCIDRSNSMDGERRTNTKAAVEEFVSGVLNDTGISKNTVFANGTYTFMAANYNILVASEDGENKLILRYNRPAGSEKPEPTPSRPQHYDPTPDGSAARSPQTGDDSATWVYILSGASLSLLLLIVIPALPRQNSGGNYKGSRKKK